MKFTEFITFCQLKGYVTSHESVNVPNWDHTSEKWYELDLVSHTAHARIRYATSGKDAAILGVSLFKHDPKNRLAVIVPHADLGAVKEAFLPDGTT